MADFVKKYYKELILIVVYIAIACAAYICWFDSLWHLWYVDVITALAIIVIGAAIGYFYIKSIENEEKKEEVRKESEQESDVK